MQSIFRACVAFAIGYRPAIGCTRRIGCWQACWLLPLIVGCSQDVSRSVAPDHAAHAPAAPRFSGTPSSAPKPGDCTFFIPVTPGGDGSLIETETGCTVSDSAMILIQVQGSLTSTGNPDADWCVPGTPKPAVGVLGPMGGGESYNWARLLVTVRGRRNSNNSAFSLGARDPETNAALRIGSANELVTYSNGTSYFIVGGGARLTVLRNGNQSTVSCTGPNEPWPPGCANGTVRRCGPINKYIVTGSQVLTVQRTNATLKIEQAPIPSYEGDTVTFTVSSTDSRPVSMREWIWQDSTGQASTPGCSLSLTTCKYVPSGNGRMTARARVGTNAFIEQVSTDVEQEPLSLALTIVPGAVLAGDTVMVFAASTPAGRVVSDLSLTSTGGASVVSCDSAMCFARIDASTTITGTATVNGRLKTAIDSVVVLPPCEPAALRSWARLSSEHIPSCIGEPPCLPTVDPNCLQPLTAQDSSLIISTTSFLRPYLSIADDSARVWCERLFNKFIDAYEHGQIFRGKYDGGEPHHFAATYQDKVHIEPSLLKAASYPPPQSDYARRLLLNVLLHEAAHLIPNTPDHLEKPPHTTSPYVYVQHQWPGGTSACVQ